MSSAQIDPEKVTAWYVIEIGKATTQPVAGYVFARLGIFPSLHEARDFACGASLGRRVDVPTLPYRILLETRVEIERGGP